MNNRLYELINECFVGTHDGKLSDMNTVHNIERFAELIIKECGEQVAFTVSGNGKFGNDIINEHFGVE